MTFEEKKDKGRHAEIRRFEFGEFHQHEFAFIGAPCSFIQNLAMGLTGSLAPLKIAYIDADHRAGDQDIPKSFPSEAVLTDMIRFRKFEGPGIEDRFSRQNLLKDLDLCLINGNHFKASSQIVILHEKKLESLSRKLDKLNNVPAIIHTIGCPEIPAFLSDHLGDKLSGIPRFDESDIDGIARFITGSVSPAPLKAMVLAGGKSTRMGKDKTGFNYHGKPQREHLLSLLQALNIPSYLSCRPEQETDLVGIAPLITDKYPDLGPYGAILSAFREDPHAAWLILAADLPLMDVEAIRELVEARDPSSVGTAFRSPVFGFPEPLVSIWEPRAHFHLLHFLGLGITCPRKVLINTSTKVLECSRPEVLSNVNTPDELDALSRQHSISLS